ncbi:MAG: nucleotidyltransferase domain-containing protein [Flavobacteriales bacterium]|nr:nucleotidyltransferase domain-containing protein [Flavobacteriales bacterium]
MAFATAIRTSPIIAQRAVLRALAYFDIFKHPLTISELHRFAECEIERGAVLDALFDLQREGLVQEADGYWALRDARNRVQVRRQSERRAVERMPKAEHMSRLIARFPYVRAVFISGSLSKGCLAPDGDIDFFIVTAPRRLWVTRTLLVLYKKVFLLNSRRDFCVNYFVDTEHLAIEDQNRFTAVELATMLPMYGNGTTEAFFTSNQWAFEMHPGAAPRKSREVAVGNSPRKSRWERRLNGSVGDWLDEWCMKATWRFWNWKFRSMDRRTFEVALRTRTYVSKHHPRNFQQRVLEGLNERIAELEPRFGSSLS